MQGVSILRKRCITARLSGRATRSAGRFFAPAMNSTAIADHHQCGSQISFLLLQRFQSVGVRDLDEPQLMTGAELSGDGEVGCDHVSDPGIATGRMQSAISSSNCPSAGSCKVPGTTAADGSRPCSGLVSSSDGPRSR